jgi:cell division protein ZapA (FtsZ GTPase activity inhibitor)
MDAREAESVSIKIAGRAYRVRTDGDPAHLENVASYVDDVLRGILETTPDTSDAAILTALNVASELLELRDHLTVVPRERLKALVDLLDAV